MEEVHESQEQRRRELLSAVHENEGLASVRPGSSRLRPADLQLPTQPQSSEEQERVREKVSSSSCCCSSWQTIGPKHMSSEHHSTVVLFRVNFKVVAML